MKTHYEEVNFKTRVDEIVDITSKVEGVVDRSGLRNGTACVFCIGSTSAVTTMEYESGLVADIDSAMERLLPKGIRYEHEMRWHDGNGHSHVRASFLGPSLTIPFKDGRMMLGTWQQVIFLELDKSQWRRRC